MSAERTGLPNTELELSGACTATVGAAAGVGVTEKEELRSRGGKQVARNSIPNR